MINKKQLSNEPHMHLMRQHRTEWNTILGLETAVRNALYAKQERERIELAQGEVNFQQRGELTRQHLKEVDRLRQQDRQNRMAIQKRHTQELAALNEHI